MSARILATRATAVVLVLSCGVGCQKPSQPATGGAEQAATAAAPAVVAPAAAQERVRVFADVRLIEPLAAERRGDSTQLESQTASPDAPARYRVRVPTGVDLLLRIDSTAETVPPPFELTWYLPDGMQPTGSVTAMKCAAPRCALSEKLRKDFDGDALVEVKAEAPFEFDLDVEATR